MEEHLRHLDDRAPIRIIVSTEVGEADAADASVRIRAKHARKRQDR